MNRRSFIGLSGSFLAGWTLLPQSAISGFDRKRGKEGPVNSFLGNSALPGKRWWEKEPLRIVELEEGYEFGEKASLLDRLGANMEHLTTFKDTSPGTSFLYNHHLFTGKGVDLDSLAEYLNEVHKKNIKVIIYYNVHAILFSYANEHPEWQQIKDDGNPVDQIYEIDSSFCINSPWREEVFDTLKKLSAYKIDGVFYDGPIFFSNTCYCDSCRKLFKEKYKKEIPLKTKMASTRSGAAWRELVEFQSDSIARFLKDSNDILKKVSPGCLFYMNGSTLGPTWPTGRDNRKIIRESDILGAEGGFLYGALTEPIYKPGAVAKLLEAQAGGKPTVIFNAAKQGPWAISMLAAGEINILYSQTITHQANVWLAVCDDPDAHGEEIEVIEKYNRFIRRNPEPFMNTVSAAKIALVWPQEGSNYYGGSSVPLTDFTKAMSAQKAGNLTGEFYGFYEALSRAHFPFDVIDEVSLQNDLEKYELIILPNAPCFSKDQIERIRNFVENGGNLISTFETSHYNEDGRKLTNFQLNDVFGIESSGDIFGPLNHDYVAVKEERRVSLKGIRQKLLYAPAYGMKIKTGPATIAPLFFCKPLPGSYAGIPDESVFPFLIENEFGKGKSVYFAGSFGDSLNKFQFPEYYRIVANLAADLSTQVIEVQNTPSSVEVSLRKKGNLIFLYLINFTSDMRRPIQQIITCTNLKIRVLISEKVKSVKTLWMEKKIEFTQRGNSVDFVLPAVDAYEVVEIKI